MPNHITNILRITGKDAEKAYNAIEGNGEDSERLFIDFNNIIAMPEELRGTTSPAPKKAKKIIQSCKGDPVKVATYLKKHTEDLLGNVDEDTKTLIAFARCGITDWYTWASTNWGTKWNAYSQSKEESGEVQFDTAWSTPFPVMQKLSLMFPEATITVEYADEDLGSNCGRYVLENGETIEKYLPDGDEALMFACEIKGCDYDQIVAEREQDSE